MFYVGLGHSIQTSAASDILSVIFSIEWELVQTVKQQIHQWLAQINDHMEQFVWCLPISVPEK